MPVNRHKPERWKQDIAQSVDMYSDWFISPRPDNRMPAMMSAYPSFALQWACRRCSLRLMTMTPAQAQTTSATYTVTFQGNWTLDSTPGGVVSSAHFTRLVGAVHNDMVTFWESGGTATAGVEGVAELGATGTFESEVAAAGANASLVKQSIGGTGTSKATFDIEVTNDRPLFTLLSMIGPSPDWFVGVSGLSLLNAQGQWRSSREVNLFPYDAGTKDGTEFQLGGSDTSPRGTIASIRGTGKFSNEPMAMLSFERQGTDNDTGGGGGGPSGPSERDLTFNYPHNFNAEERDGFINVQWSEPAYPDVIDSLEYKVQEGWFTSAAYDLGDVVIPWTRIDKAATSLDIDIYALAPDTKHIFFIRSVMGERVSSATRTNLPVVHYSAVSVEGAELPAEVELSQNYPNPFNPQTTIDYALPQAGDVSLVVYDLVGRIVSTLIDGIQPAGHHEVRFNAGDLPTGTYLYRLRTGAETVTRTMTLMR